MILNEFLTCQKKILYNFISKLQISNLQIYFNYASVLQISIYRIKYIFDLTVCYKVFQFIRFYQKTFWWKFRFRFKYLKKMLHYAVLYCTYTPLHKKNANFNLLKNENYSYNHDFYTNSCCFLVFILCCSFSSTFLA